MTDDEHFIKIENEDGVGPIEHVILHGARLVMNDANENDLWDQPPALWAVVQGQLHADPDGLPEGMPEEMRREIVEYGALGQMLGFSPLAINPEAWATGPVARVLSKLARWATKHPPRLEEDLEPGQRIIGLLFMSEAWMLATRDLDENDTQDTVAAAHRGELHLDPRRIEIRMVYGVDLAGYSYAIQHKRDSDEPDMETINGPGVPKEGRGRLQMVGEIPDALTLLLSALTPEDSL